MATTPPRRGPVWPPIRAMLFAVPFTCLVGALVTDIAYANSAQVQWANFSVWLIAAGAAVGWIALVADAALAALRRGRPDRRGAFRRVVTVFALVFAVVNGFVHSRDAWTSVVPDGLVLSAITAALILAAGWMTYATGDAAPAGEA